VLTHAEDVNYIHFACHGVYDPRNPFASSLQLADFGALTLSDVMSRLRLSGANLVCLSACETGITESQTTPDEFLGLPAAFHQAGAPAVSSTLWAVDDRVTMILMDRFYHFFRGADMSFPAALPRGSAVAQGRDLRGCGRAGRHVPGPSRLPGDQRFGEKDVS